MARKRKPDGMCQFPGCENKAVSRDNCPTCRKAAEAMIARGEVTEDQLIARGWVAPAKRKGRPPNSAAAKAIAALK